MADPNARPSFKQLKLSLYQNRYYPKGFENSNIEDEEEDTREGHIIYTGVLGDTSMRVQYNLICGHNRGYLQLEKKGNEKINQSTSSEEREVEKSTQNGDDEFALSTKLFDVTRQNSVEQCTGETYLSELMSNCNSKYQNGGSRGRMQSLQEVEDEEDDSTIFRTHLSPLLLEKRGVASVESALEEKGGEKLSGYAELDLSQQQSAEEECTFLSLSNSENENSKSLEPPKSHQAAGDVTKEQNDNSMCHDWHSEIHHDEISSLIGLRRDSQQCTGDTVIELTDMMSDSK